MTNQSPIFVKTEAFMLWLFNHTAAFPRHERFRLAKRMDDALFSFHVELMQAVNSPNALENLRQADMHLYLLRTYFRLTLELKYTSPDQFRYVAENLEEIGKLLGGWIKKA